MRLAILISGSGSNLQAIIDAIAAKQLDAEIALVVSNRKDAFGLTRAQQAGIPTLYFPLKPYTSAGLPREEYDIDLVQHLAIAQPDLVVLAGWLHIFTPAFLERLAGRVINLHPALPGMFPGMHSIQEAFDAFQRGQLGASGCMIHDVIPELDAGPVIVQQVVPFVPGDTLQSFEARMHEAEHEIIVEAIRRCAISLPK
jgi:formyltetrahydrofolate-dependent phosphoribosylglycinamide formyltransferase